MRTRILELFGIPTQTMGSVKWPELVRRQPCPYLRRKCLKNRKSEPNVSIGTCAVSYGKDNKQVIVCPHRMLERRQVFTDCIHLLTLHEPGNEFHVVPELAIPGGSVDFFLVSAKKRKVIDFVGIEVQTLDTTGTVWPERQRLLRAYGLRVRRRDADSTKAFGMNWKMTAKTILVQLHHKIDTFENLNRHLVLVLQNHLIEYMRGQFSFRHMHQARLGDAMHIHSYHLTPHGNTLRLELQERLSTDSRGISDCLGL